MQRLQAQNGWKFTGTVVNFSKLFFSVIRKDNDFSIE